jgi:hypothetical protein
MGNMALIDTEGNASKIANEKIRTYTGETLQD